MKLLNEKHNAIINVYQKPSTIYKSYVNDFGEPVNVPIQDDKFIYIFDLIKEVHARPIAHLEEVQHDNIVRTIDILIPRKNKFIKHTLTKDFIVDLYDQINKIESEITIKPFIDLPF